MLLNQMCACPCVHSHNCNIIHVGATTWELPGEDVCGVKKIEVVCSPHGQLITWEEFGLKLYIPDGCLPAGIEQCTLNIKASLSGMYSFPDNCHLVSAVFWLRCEPMCRFTKPVTVEIQHCAKMNVADGLNNLKFVRAICSQKQLPYTFKELGGNFSSHSSYGVIQVNGFSGLAITQEGSEDREYCSLLFYLGKPTSYQIHFVVTWNIEAQLTVSVARMDLYGSINVIFLILFLVTVCKGGVQEGESHSWPPSTCGV